jgi:pyruvyltransferase
VNPLRLYYVPCGHRSGNFGDMYSAEVVAHMSGREVVGVGETNEGIATAEFVADGSLAQNLPANFVGAVWGTGLMFEMARIEARDTTVAALRGKLTARRWPKRPDCVLGDPGLLLGLTHGLAFGAGEKRWRLGIVPHFVDMEDPALAEFLKRNRCAATCIDVCSPDMPRLVSECETVLSSSLHGLVTADALGVPNAWIYFGDRVQGGSFKFRDYVSAFHIHDRVPCRLEPGSTVEDAARYAEDEWTWGDKVAGVVRGLRESFPRYLARQSLDAEIDKAITEIEIARGVDG